MKEIIMELLVIARSLEDKTTRVNEVFNNAGWTFLDDEISSIADLIYQITNKENDDLKDIIFNCIQSNISIEDCIKALYEEGTNETRGL